MCQLRKSGNKPAALQRLQRKAFANLLGFDDAADDEVKFCIGGTEHLDLQSRILHGPDLYNKDVFDEDGFGSHVAC